MNTELSDAEARYENFFREVNRTSTIWALAQDNQLAIWSDEEGSILPVWSQERQALAGRSAFPACEVRSYTLLGFIEEVLPQIQTNEVMIGLNLDESMGGMDLSCAEVSAALTRRRRITKPCS